ncbi:DUF932 domain-containing protein [Candidatus Pacearchaeota archaeon]|nr:DUF932 domain-containing protein [Candidatus Pacearchaeota archaeon]|tara:strand:+ start:1980 stop:2885 length:906 start_codon:yes stop_codon:yes gene_type:complete
MSESKSKVNLRICGGEHKVSTLEEVQAVTTPELEYRKDRNKDGSLSVSYQPISHNLLIDKTRKHLDQGGFEVVDECHNLARDGKRYFGLFEVSHPNRENSERGTIVGLRNAHDKCFPAGLCAGDAPFVCDNLIFTNQVKLARRHTKNILGELDQVIARTLGRLFDFWVGQDNRVDSYKAFDLANPQVNDLVIRAYKAGAIPKTKIADVVDQWESSDHDAFRDRNMNSLYNAFTEVYKGNLIALPNRSEALHSVLDSEVGFDLSSFESQEEVVEGELVEVGVAEESEIVGNVDGEVPEEYYF